MARMRRQVPAQTEFFPGFEDVAELGVGSLATVYRAREVATNRPVALKLLNVRDATPTALEAFDRETAALAAISSHPNIVTLYRSFRVPDGRPVLVLERCTGTVSHLLRGGDGLAARQVVSIGIPVAGALETAHRAGILHRDVKPQNILLTGYGQPALADFGVAALHSATETTAGLFDFTTLHAAPELLEGEPSTPATDVYELASSLYQMLAGRSAFRARQGESPASVILRILRDPVPPLAHLPGELFDLLREAMSKDPGRRPATAAGFGGALAAVEQAQGWPATEWVVGAVGTGPRPSRRPQPGTARRPRPAPAKQAPA